MPVAIVFYDVVLSIHVMAIVAAFGVWFAYPLLVVRGDAGAHRAQARVARMVVNPAGTLALGTAAWYLLTVAAGGRAAMAYAVPVAAAWAGVALAAGALFGVASAFWIIGRSEDREREGREGR